MFKPDVIPGAVKAAAVGALRGFALGILFVLLVKACSTPAPAAELILHGPSYHFDRDAGHNNANYGVGYLTDSLWAAGVYRNSLDRTTVYGGKVFEIGAGFTALVGLATGYNGAPVIPAAVITWTPRLDSRIQPHFNFLPIPDGFVNLALGVRL